MPGDRTLRDLIDKALERHSTTNGAELARLAQVNGFRLVRTTINHIRNGTYRNKPGKETLEAVAWLAGVSLADAYEAAQLPFGVPYKPPPGSDRMSPEERDVIDRMIRLILKRYQDSGELPGDDLSIDNSSHTDISNSDIDVRNRNSE